MVYVGDVVLDVDLLIECVLALLEKCEVRAKESERLSATGCWILASRMASKGLASAVSLAASWEGPANATTARRVRGLAAMLLLWVDLPRAVLKTATRAER